MIKYNKNSNGISGKSKNIKGGAQKTAFVLVATIAIIIAIVILPNSESFLHRLSNYKNIDSKTNLSSLSQTDDSNATDSKTEGDSVADTQNSQTISQIPSPTPNMTAQAVITSVGDIILHQAVIDGGLQNDGTYIYDYIFEYVNSFFTDSDYTIANYEGALNGPPYSGYPAFGGPDAIATALATAGVDMVTTANNHSFDKGLAGLKRTPEVFIKEGIEVIGTRTNAQDPKFKIVDINGIKIGITGYTYETIGTETSKALNGIILPQQAQELVDSFNPSRPDHYAKDQAEMASRIVAIKEAGAQCIVFVLHWGEEYKIVSNAKQKNLAQFLSDQGVDVIFGHHPHVLQEISVVSSKISGKSTLVYYSLGNFLANMAFGTHGTNGYAQDAMIAKVTIDRDENGQIKVSKGEYIGTYVHSVKSGSKTIHKIIPVQTAINNPELFRMQTQIGLIKNAQDRIDNVLSKSNGIQSNILIQKYNK